MFARGNRFGAGFLTATVLAVGLGAAVAERQEAGRFTGFATTDGWWVVLDTGTGESCKSIPTDTERLRNAFEIVAEAYPEWTRAQVSDEAIRVSRAECRAWGGAP